MLNYADLKDLDNLGADPLAIIDLLDDVARDVRAWADNLQAVSVQAETIGSHQLEPISVCLTYAGAALRRASAALSDMRGGVMG